MKSQCINIITLGCSKNTVDSEFLAGHLMKTGYQVEFDATHDKAEIIIINTCGFIGDAKEESIDTILHFSEIRKKGKIKKLIVAGCLSQRYIQELTEEIPHVDAFYGVHQWEEILKSLISENLHSLYDERITSTPPHYAYLKIAEGCNRSCSYCAIPLIRGEHISRPVEDLVDEANMLVDKGVKELLVISQDTTYYGIDLYGKCRLPELMERLAEINRLEWIRLHYTYPMSFPEELLSVMQKHENICKYLDMPFQHISNSILKSMRRGVNRDETYTLIEKIRKHLPSITLRTTLIVGYPGETEKEFEELKEFISRVRFDRLGVFQYSQEEGTPAYSLGDTVADELKQQRQEELMDIQQEISLEINQSKIGKTFKTIIDRLENDFWIGRTEYDSPEVDNEVLIPANQPLEIGNFYPVKIMQAEEYDLFGEVI